MMRGKLKLLFSKKGLNSSSGSGDDGTANQQIFTNDIVSTISSEASIAMRIETLKDLCGIVESRLLEEHAVEMLFKTINDLFSMRDNDEARHTAFQFTISLAKGQYDRLQLFRSSLFHLIVHHDLPDDLSLRIDLLDVMTDQGKNVAYCEQIGKFLTDFMPDALYATNSDVFFNVLINIIHYNSSFLDKDVNTTLVRKACDFCNNANNEKDIENCLFLLDATVRYSGFSSNALLPIIETLCRTVNIEKFCQLSWKLMRNLVGTKLGHTAISIMCKILEDNNNILEIALLRGAVFFIGMSIWGSKRVPSLHYTPIHVLPSFKISLQANNYNVAYEISLSIQRVVRKFGAEQEFYTWDIILDIIETLQHLVESTSKESEKASLVKIIHGILSNIEQLYVEDLFKGSSERFFKLLASFSKTRPEKYMETLLTYLGDQVNPDHDEWQLMLNDLITQYFKIASPSFVQIKVINIVANIFNKYKFSHEAELLDIILKIEPWCGERNVQVRVELAQLYADIVCNCKPTNLLNVLLTVQTFLQSIRELEEDPSAGLHDFEVIIDSMVKAFQEKLFQPDSIYVNEIFKLLVSHINTHYVSNIASFTGGTLRKQILSLVCRLRVNSNRYIGLYAADGTKYSIHTILNSAQEHSNRFGDSQLRLSQLDFSEAYDVILKCLKNELDWYVLEFLLKNIDVQLHNKPLFITSQCNMNKLSSALCNLVKDHNSLKKVKNCPKSMNLSGLRNLIFPILAVLSSYHAQISRDRQIEFISCLEFGLNTLSAKTCVNCLTVCALEMQRVMVRLLPSILVKLSQISATVAMSAPILDFLSVLTDIPALYANFVDDQYMCIFAMALPYTDSYKYTKYTVMISHKIIADWFTRCRLLFRKGFVSLIANALKCGPYRDVDSATIQKDSEKKAFHEDMTDICLDMMSHWAFSTFSMRWKRSPLEDFLLKNGISQTWFVGNMLITITTSNHSKECDTCRPEKFSKPPPINSPDDTNKQRIKESFSAPFSETSAIDIKPVDSSAAFKCKVDNVNVVSAAIASLDQSVEEEGVEATPLVAKLASQLSDNEMTKSAPTFSPSEQLLFSRQGSKAVVKDNNEESDDSFSEDAFSDDDFDEILNAQTSPQDILKQPLTNKMSTDSKKSKLYEFQEKLKSGFTPSGGCKCECGGWAEILIRRPTTNMSWIMKCTQDAENSFTNLEELRTSALQLEEDVSPPKFDMFFESMVDPATLDVHDDCWRKNEDVHDNKSRRSASDTSSVVSFSTVPTKRMVKRRHSTGSIKSVTAHKYSFPLENQTFMPLHNQDARQSLQHSTLRRTSHDVQTDQWTSARSPSKDFISPSLIFLQLFYPPAGYKLEHPAILLESNEKIDRSIKILDRLHCMNTHKFGVLYVNKGQEKNELKILLNEFGSPRYTNFVSGLGELVRLSDCEAGRIYLGGLSEGGADGKFACVWRDETTNVVFHVATLMSVKESDTHCNSKKRHIGNDAITIIYDDSKRGYEYGTIKGQFNFAEIVIRPLDYDSNRVMLRKKTDQGVCNCESYVVSDDCLPILVRKIAIHSNISVISEMYGKTTANSFAFNWLERLRQIKAIKTKSVSEPLVNGYDFTCYT